MPQDRRALPFRWLLPATQLIICVLVLWPVRSRVIDDVRGSVLLYRTSKSSALNTPDPQALVLLQIRPLDQEEQHELDVFERRKMVPVMLNVPSLLVQLPDVILSADKDDWVPRGMDLWTWRAIALPLIGILFWWSAGRGIEALFAARWQLLRPRIRWIEAIAGTTLFLFCAVATVGLPLGSGKSDEGSVKFIVTGMALWAVLGGIVAAARIVQWRVSKRTSALAAGDAPTV